MNEELLECISSGDLTAEEARKAIAGLPKRLDSREAARLYHALRAWTWKALDQRRRDEDLREWADIMRRVTLRTGSKEGRDKQLETLADLVAESVAVATRLPVAAVLAKRHIRELLVLLLSTGADRVSKKTIMETLGLEQSNLSRIGNLMSAAGLVEIEKNGRETSYTLTRSGSNEAMKLSSGIDTDINAEMSSRPVFSWRDLNNATRKVEKDDVSLPESLLDLEHEVWSSASDTTILTYYDAYVAESVKVNLVDGLYKIEKFAPANDEDSWRFSSYFAIEEPSRELRNA